MSILPQAGLFSWKEVELTSEISRLTRLLDVLPDQELLAALETARAGKRDDYPLAALGRALVRNGQLRDLRACIWSATGPAQKASTHRGKTLFRKSLSGTIKRRSGEAAHGDKKMLTAWRERGLISTY